MNGQANRYHGLINQGSTCYLNSVLQVLFMTEDFREAVTRNSEENPHTEFIDHDLKVLFDDLQNHRAYTYKITKKLGINNVNEQRDAAEYFERILRMTSPDASKIFHGQLVNKTTCSEDHIQTDGDAPFWHLPLSLVDSCSEYYSVVKGIEEFFKPSDFCGENQMYCDQCDEKVDATMTDVIKHHPDVLCLLLKRFEFNYKYMSYIKINCSVDVPYTLQIPESQKYELYAFVDHFGDLRGGHYTATIKIQEKHRDRWYQFDDTRVTELDYQPFQLDNTERSKTAYLLFYRKNKADTGVQDFRDVSNIGSIPLTTSDEYDQSQDGKNQRKRRREGEETDIEYNPKAPRLREAEGSPDTPCNVDTPQKEPDEDNATTGSDDLDQKHTEVDDAKKNRPDDNPDFIPAVSDTSAVCDDLNREYEMSKLMDDKTDKDEKAKDKQSEKKSHTEHSADTVGENICGHQENKQTTENYYSPCPNHAEEDEEKIWDSRPFDLRTEEASRMRGETSSSNSKQSRRFSLQIPLTTMTWMTENLHRHEEKTKTDFQHDTKGKTSADKPTAETCCDTFQDKDKVDEGKENILQDDHSHKHGNKHSDTMKMQEISVTHSNDNDVCVEREINNMKEDRRERNDDHKGDHSKFGQNTAGEVSGAAKTQEDVDVEEEMKVKEYEGNTEQIQIRKNSHLRPAGAEIIGGPRENQDAAANEKTKAESCQPKARAEIEEVTDGGRGSQKSEKVQATYEQKMQNHDGESFGTKMKNTGIEIVEKSSHGRSERRVKNNEGNTKKEEHGDRLYNFDDTGVTDLDYQPFQVDNTEKSESAYLLLCRKKKDTVTEEVKEMLAQNGGFPPSNTDNSDQCQEPGKEAEVHKYGQSIVNKMEETLSGNKILTFKDTQLQENVKSHKNADQAMVLKRNVDHDFNLEVNDNPAVHGHLKKQDVMNDGQKGLMDLRPERNEQTDKKWLSLTAHHKSHTDCQGSEGADASRKDTREYDGGRENIGKDYSSKSASVEADKVRTRQRKLLTRYDLFHGSPDEQTGSDRIQIIPKDNQMNEQRRISRFLNEPIEEDVMGEARDHDVTHSAHKDVSVQTQRRSVRDERENTKESDKYIHMNEVTTENPDNSEAVKHVSMRLDGRGQKTAEKIISVTRTSQSVGGVQIQSKEQKNECDTKQNQSEGNKITKERQTEKQAGGSDENIGLERFQPKARTGAQGLTEGGHGSTMSRLLVKIIDEEHTEIDSACKDDSQTKTIIKKTMDETTQNMTKWLEKQKNIRRNLHLEIDKEVTLDKMSTF